MEDGAGFPTGTPLSDPALVEMISEDPVLRNTKLIAEAWDCDGLNQVGAFPHYGGRWAEWNGHFRDSVRTFIKVRTTSGLHEGDSSLLSMLVEQAIWQHLTCGTVYTAAALCMQICPMRRDGHACQAACVNVARANGQAT